MKLSVVVPVRNEAGSVDEFVRRTHDALSVARVSHEIIFVDDGSGDGTFERCCQHVSEGGSVKVIKLSRNFGQQAALYAGLIHATGEWVATMDGDLQHPPELLPAMLSRAGEGYEVVNMRRKNAGGTAMGTRLGSRFFYCLFNSLSQVKLDEGMGEFRLVSRRVAIALTSMTESHRFNRALVKWLGFRQSSLDYAAPARANGTPSTSFLQRLGEAMTGITAFSARPLHLSFVVGFLVAAGATFEGAYVLWGWLQGNTVPGWTSILLTVLFLGGFQLMAIGIIGEYVARIYDEVKRRDVYVLEDKRGFGP